MKNVLNYGITYKIKTVDGSAAIDETYITKKAALTRYLDILDGNKIFPSSGVGSISELTIYRAFKNKPIEDITRIINKFIMG